MALTPARRHLAQQVSSLISLTLPNVPPPTTRVTRISLCTPSQRIRCVSGFAFSQPARRHSPPNRVRHPADRQFASSCSPPRLAATQLPSATGSWLTLTRTLIVLCARLHERTRSLPASEPCRATGITSGEYSPAGRLLQGKTPQHATTVVRAWAEPGRRFVRTRSMSRPGSAQARRAQRTSSTNPRSDRSAIRGSKIPAASAPPPQAPPPQACDPHQARPPAAPAPGAAAAGRSCPGAG